ncbi:ribokinase [Solibacillus sp. R5-41]|uniref:ribokinase n=1 Tax=Solibacillus sp. R5-41 TaxID=2048654 RepID=UPI000C1279D4|nr:ribokinase [Solibacillus sp. R5-41]ATP41421.1 ribokinase [Solibacillus sp. R5-41]
MITVIGSINMDIAVSTEQFPVQGETVFGTDFATIPGGKGANQAVAAAKLGSNTNIVGCVGNDAFGGELLKNLDKYQINTSTVQMVSNSTGIATILLYEQDNRIIVVPGANAALTKEKIDESWATIEQSKLVVLQLEIPKETVAYVIERCNEANIPILLNPAPATHFMLEWMDKVSYITPNESECEQIFQEPFEKVVEKYPNKVIVTLGSKGACYHDGERFVMVNSYQSEVIDTTGAGDTFNGALAYALTNDASLEKAIQFANCAASLSVESFGAQGGMPTITEVIIRLQQVK